MKEKKEIVEQIWNNIVFGIDSDKKDDGEGESGNRSDNLTFIQCNHHQYEYCQPCTIYKDGDDDGNKDNVKIANKPASHGPPATPDPEANRPLELAYLNIAKHLQEASLMRELFQQLEKSVKYCALGKVEVQDVVFTIIVNYA